VIEIPVSFFLIESNIVKVQCSAYDQEIKSTNPSHFEMLIGTVEGWN
jgi:hypothetical protein